MMPRSVMLLALMVIAGPHLHGGDAEPRARSASIFLGAGPSEEIHAGFSVQASPRFSIGPIAGGFLIRSHIETRLEMLWALGLRTSYYFSPDGAGYFLGCNNLTCDILYLPPHDIPPDGNRFRPSGAGIETTLGRDCTLTSGLGLSWAAGLSMSFHRDVAPLFFPALKLGVHADI